MSDSPLSESIHPAGLHLNFNILKLLAYDQKDTKPTILSLCTWHLLPIILSTIEPDQARTFGQEQVKHDPDPNPTQNVWVDAVTRLGHVDALVKQTNWY